MFSHCVRDQNVNFEFDPSADESTEDESTEEEDSDCSLGTNDFV